MKPNNLTSFDVIFVSIPNGSSYQFRNSKHPDKSQSRHGQTDGAQFGRSVDLVFEAGSFEDVQSVFEAVGLEDGDSVLRGEIGDLGQNLVDLDVFGDSGMKLL